MKLIIAEKPELARNIARVVCGATQERVRLPYEGNGYLVCACAGHVLELAEPDKVDPSTWGKPWREESLPVLPRPWPKVVTPGKEELVENIKRGLARCDGVIHAGDPDDEGQLIVDEVLEFLRYDGPVVRVLVNDNIDRNIRRAFENLTPNSGHEGAGRAADARGIADFCFGATESRLATLRAGHGKLLSIGRVQTPTLALVVARDEEIEAHKARTYFTIEGTGAVDTSDGLSFKLAPDRDMLDTDKLLCDRTWADNAAKVAGSYVGPCETRVARKETEAPLPYNLTTLTQDMSKRHKMSAKRVMDATQSLRDDHRAITYNRSDCPYLPEAALAEAPATLGTALGNLGLVPKLDYSLYPRCFDDSKIDAHTAIIPQDIHIDTSALSHDELLVYTAIVCRYAQQFAGPEVADISETRATCKVGTLFHKARRVLSKGWKAIGETEDDNEVTERGWIDAGRHTLSMAEAHVTERKTKPKPRYTEGTLVADMAHASKYVSDPSLRDVLVRKDDGKPGEHGSIGTTATRASIIETCKKRGYLREEKGHLVSTDLARTLIHACPDDIKSVDTTARWWLIQEQVAQGAADTYAVAEEVVRVFEGHRATAWVGTNLGQATRICTCPRCGSDVVDKGKKTYTCSSNTWEKKADGTFVRTGGCGLMVQKVVLGHKLTPKECECVLSGKPTRVIKGLHGKSGKRFDAALVWNDEEGRVTFAGRLTKGTVATTVVGTCPVCGADVVDRGGKKYMCTNSSWRSDEFGNWVHSGSCTFEVMKVFCGHELTKEELGQILAGKQTHVIKGLRGKTGKRFDAALVWDGDEGRVTFAHDTPKDARVVGTCPVCGADVVDRGGTRYACVNSSWRKDRHGNWEHKGSCAFEVTKTICGHTVTETELERLLAGDETDVIHGLKGKSGKSFDAALAWDPDEGRVRLVF